MDELEELLTIPRVQMYCKWLPLQLCTAPAAYTSWDKWKNESTKGVGKKISCKITGNIWFPNYVHRWDERTLELLSVNFVSSKFKTKPLLQYSTHGVANYGAKSSNIGKHIDKNPEKLIPHFSFFKCIIWMFNLKRIIYVVPNKYTQSWGDKCTYFPGMMFSLLILARSTCMIGRVCSAMVLPERMVGECWMATAPYSTPIWNRACSHFSPKRDNFEQKMIFFYFSVM